MRASDDDSPLKHGNFPAPSREAQFLFHVAIHNGGIEKMRALIRISPQDQKNLERLVADGHVAQCHYDRARDFREQVLQEFDRLVKKSGGNMST